MIACEDLNSPINGAIGCDKWSHGLHCQIQCEESYDIPRSYDGVNFNGFFTCDDTKGTWTPEPPVPDCISKEKTTTKEK